MTTKIVPYKSKTPLLQGTSIVTPIVPNKLTATQLHTPITQPTILTPFILAITVIPINIYDLGGTIENALITLNNDMFLTLDGEVLVYV